MNLKHAPIFGSLALMMLTGCSTVPIDGSDGAKSGFAAPERSRRVSRKAALTPLEKGRRHYREGSYGLAEAIFRKEVEIDSSNADAWLGLAASYDRLRRFDLAMRAYSSVTRLRGFTPTVLNNLGYHYYLQGKMASAIKTMERARAADPTNRHVINILRKFRAAARKRKPRRAKG